LVLVAEVEFSRTLDAVEVFYDFFINGVHQFELLRKLLDLGFVDVDVSFVPCLQELLLRLLDGVLEAVVLLDEGLDDFHIVS